MGAIASTVLALCSAGDHIVIQRQIYAGTMAFVQGACARFGIEHTVVDGTVPGAFAEAVRPGRTMLVLAESPSNPRLDLVDLADLGAVQRPVHRRRLDVRHADRPAAAAPRRRPRRCTRRRRASPATTTPRSASSPASATCSTRSGPTACCTARRRRRTTPSTRCAASARWPCASATRPTSPCASPQRLADHPGVAAVHHPGLPDHPQHDLAIGPADVPADRVRRSTSPAASTPPAR